MRIDAFRFRHVGPFGADGIEVSGFRPGLNVIAEHNERGKSSLLAALETVLFLPHTSWKGDAKRLQRNDGAPVGEVDFTHAGRAYRLVKRFVKSRHTELIDLTSGTIVATKREAEERVGEMLGLNSTARGPSGLLWVRQGDSMDQAQDDGQVASRLESELSTLVGGERARAYLDRTETELYALLTATGRVKTGGPLALAEDALATTESNLEVARTAQSATRQMGLDLARVLEQIAVTETQGDTNTEITQLKDARAALDKARIARSELDRLTELLARLQAETERADAKLAAHLAATKALDDAQTDIDNISSAVTALSTRKADVLTHLTGLSDHLQGLEARRATLSKLDADQATRERLIDRNAALQAVIVNLEALDIVIDTRASHVAQRDALPLIDRTALDRMDQLRRTLDQTQTALAHVDSTLLVDFAPDIVATIGDTVVTNGPIQLNATTALTIAGVGTIILAAPEAETLRATLTQTQDALEALFEALGVSSPEEAAAALHRRKDIMDDIALIDRKITLIAPDGRDALIDARDRLQGEIDRLAGMLNDMPVDEVKIDGVALEATLAQTRGEQRAAQTTLSEIDRELATLQERLNTRRRDLASAPDTATPAKRKENYGALAAAAASLATQVETAKTTLNDTRAQGPSDPALFEARIKRLSDVARTRTETLSRLRIDAAELAARRRESFEQRDPDAEVTRLEDRAVQLMDTVDRHRKRAAALSLLRDTLKDSQRSLQDQYTDPVRQELLPLLRLVIDGADVELSETLGAQGLMRDGRDDSLERLSGGTQEQIAILTRLAFARLLTKGGQPCPVILDDALVYADDRRRGRMFDVMHYVTSGDDPLQLLYLSCHEANANELGGNRLTLKPWVDS
ncbi:GTP-binding protein [Algimonas arctica]|uniref:GTP-binding protein n=1 Tax=Algimonas arctica TaxID=1479486 RepID=A0A8J3CQW6_9PROT|nr:AAA family ATPase [Algimonas arctica]GHA88724.1 GTP-binding protein [Algimonas arctica]